MTASAASRSMLLAAARTCSRVPSAGGNSSRSVLGCQSSNFVASVCSMRSHRPEHVTVVETASTATWGHSLTRSSSSNATPSRMEHNYETQVSPKVEKVFDKILDLDMFEIHLVTELVAEKLGMNVDVSAAAGGGGGGLGGSKSGDASAEEAQTEEKTAFDLKLVSFDAKAKIKVIKEVRSIAGLGLKEAKELVEGAPKTVMKEIKMDEAEEIKAKLEALGAVVEIV